ncbi:MAG: acetyl-CoA carboxylase biotin carboxyl carrier protein [Candidatus Aquirickettsiella sp.]
MDSEKINQLIKLLNENGLSEIEFSEGDQSIRIKRESIPATNTTRVQPSPPNVTSTQASSSSALEAETNSNILLAPVLGTVYLAPSPGAEPFVSLEQKVKKGDILCIIEAMKMMNRVDAHKDGIIKKRLVENGMPVQYHQPLFIIE